MLPEVVPCSKEFLEEIGCGGLAETDVVARAVFVGTKLIGIFFCHIVADGVAEVGAIPFSGLFKKSFHKQALKLIAETEASGVFHRLQVTILSGESFRRCSRWAERLGFIQEGWCRGYHPDGRDALMMGKVV